MIASCARPTAGAASVEPTAAPPAARSGRPIVASAPAAPACLRMRRRDIFALSIPCGRRPLLVCVSVIVVPTLNLSSRATAVSPISKQSDRRADHVPVPGSSFRVPVLRANLNLDHVLVLLDRLDRPNDVIEWNDLRDDVFRVEATT